MWDIQIIDRYCIHPLVKQAHSKNTLMLYMRMLLIMAVTLYTSRIILNTLGVEGLWYL